MKRLLIIDPDFVWKSPSMKGILRSLPAFRAAGYEPEAWCWEIENGVNIDKVSLLPSLGARKLKMLQAIIFSAQVTCLYIWRFSICGQQRPDIIYSCVPYLPFCDVAHTQFSPWDWLKHMKKMGRTSVRDWLEYWAWCLLAPWYRLFLETTTTRMVIAPSRAVAQDYSFICPERRVEVIANSFDQTRFNQQVRKIHRQPVRTKLGYEPEHRVFIFVSTGHYKRKGFFIAVAAMNALYQRQPNVRFLVVGGQEHTLGQLRRRLDAEFEGWRDWLYFVGSTTTPEQYFAAADAFLYPSWSEAFALVEIEAAACGLPLFLTAHHGSEMVLEEGVNGRFISFDPYEIMPVLESFVTGEWQPISSEVKEAMDSNAYAARLTDVIRSCAIQNQEGIKSKCA